MTRIELTEAYIAGAASVECVDGDLQPWRLPHPAHHLFPSPDDGLLARAACTSGVRLRLETDATDLTLQFRPLPEAHAAVPDGHAFDLVIDNKIAQVARGGLGATEVTFTGLPSGRRVVEAWLPPSCPVTLTGLMVNASATARPLPDRRPLWVTWGSSLTHCVRAGSAGRTWPATVARAFDLNLMNLGFGGQCHLDPAVAMYIRDLPAAYITLKLGVNTISGSVNARTYPVLVTAAVAIIREKHPHTPLALISPFGFPRNEDTPNVVGYTIGAMRRDMEAVYRRFLNAGDRNLYYVNGARIFTLEDIAAYTEDQCHAGPAGIDLQAERVAEHVMPLLLGRT